MASFDYKAYAETVAAAQNRDKNSGAKVGFFKLADGGEALVRFDVRALDDLDFASIHRVKRNPEDRFCSMTVSCLNPLGHSGECPLCEAAAAGNESVQKVGKRVFVKLLVSYKDSATGAWGVVTPVVWERPAGFYKELMAKLNDYGDLSQHLFKIVRSGAGLDTKYSINYAVPAIYKADMVPADFSAFDGFEINKHSYWEKTAEECEEYLRTGSFPERAHKETVAEAKAAEEPVDAKLVEVKAEIFQPIDDTLTSAVEEKPVEEKQTDTGFNFNGFSF
jgi:hypothetical protein